MKKLILIIGLTFGSVSLMADYVAGFISCQHPKEGYTYFIVKGKGANLSSPGHELAMADFLNAEYAGETNRYCDLNKVYTDGTVFSYSTKSKANKKFSELINKHKDARHVKKLLIIKRGYDESDWN